MKIRIGILTAFGVLLLFIGMIASIHIGAKNIPLNEVYQAIVQPDDSINAQLVRDVRLPRMLCAVLTGGMLALTGTMMQGVMRNPIAEPSVLGVTQGASLAVAISAVSPVISTGNFFMALIGAFISGILILLFTMQ